MRKFEIGIVLCVAMIVSLLIWVNNKPTTDQVGDLPTVTNAIEEHNHESEVIVEQVVVEQIVIKPVTIVEEEFIITYYCACEICCGVHADGITASGKPVEEGLTIAVDKSVIELGSRVVIEGFNTVFEAQDTGHPDYMSGNRIDIYIADHDRALELGRHTANVWVLE